MASFVCMLCGKACFRGVLVVGWRHLYADDEAACGREAQPKDIDAVATADGAAAVKGGL